MLREVGNTEKNMKKRGWVEYSNYFLSALTVIILVILKPNFTNAQQGAYLNPHSIAADISDGGTLFNVSDTARYTNNLSALLKIDSGTIPTILSSAFWVTGIDAGGNLKGVVSTIYPNKDWATGPYSTSYDSTYDSLYNRAFKVLKTDIDYHIAHYMDNGYQIPTSIAQWPGNGRTAFHELADLAPFVDANNNGIYDPQNGDYPNICGDEAVFFMLNDARNLHNEFEGEPLDVQLNVLAFDFQNNIASQNTAALNNTIFLKCNLVNCSTTNYYQILFSLFNEYQIGCYGNDRAGCDTTLNTIFGYNGTYPDTGCSYGNSQANKVAQAATFLNQKLYTNVVIDSFSHYFTSAFWPVSLASPRSLQSGYWPSSTLNFTVGGDGYGGSTPTNYLYPGNPLNPNDWSDMTSGTTPGERTGIGTINIDTFPAGATKNIDIAFVSSFVPASDTANEITELKNEVATVQEFYSTLGQCGKEYTPITEIPANENVFKIHPNPASDFVQLDFSLANSANVSIQITDIAGKVVDREPLGMLASGTYSHRINITGFSKGMYFCNLLCGTHTTTQKLIKIE